MNNYESVECCKKKVDRNIFLKSDESEEYSKTKCAKRRTKLKAISPARSREQLRPVF